MRLGTRLFSGAIIFLLGLNLFAQTDQNRGFEPVIHTGQPNTSTTRLYKESHALVIGASRYRNGWSQLNGVLEDVRQVELALSELGFQVTKVSDPTRKSMLASIDRFINQHGNDAENRLLIFYAGHGYTVEMEWGGGIGYLVPVDAPPPDDKDAFLEKAIEMTLIDVYAQKIRSNHAIFLFDSCFSGALFTQAQSSPKSLNQNTMLPVRQYITSGSEDQEVPDDSVFCQQFILGIQGQADRNEDGFVSGSELGKFLIEKVEKQNLKAYGQVLQSPQYGKIHNHWLSRGDFLFLRQNHPNTLLPPIPEPEPPPPREWIIADLGMVLKPIPGGTFAMGSPVFEKGRFEDERHHWVTITRPFWIGQYEVTQAEWEKVMGANPSKFAHKDFPVDQVSWLDIQNFCRTLNANARKSGRLPEGYVFRLPTEAEWEYACRGGSSGRFGRRLLNAIGWYRQISQGSPRPVGQGKSNLWGLYDMHGNVFEWCHDGYEAYPVEGVNDPIGEGTDPVLKGGSWNSLPAYCRSAARSRATAEFRFQEFGFRLALAPELDP